MTLVFDMECTDEGDCTCEVCQKIAEAGITDEIEKEFFRDMIEVKISHRMILTASIQHGFDMSDPKRAALIEDISNSFDVEMTDEIPEDDDIGEVIVPLHITTNRLH